ncbi:hypothetical protein E2C01_006123 [Portunus trituberculatus]|uniref:Uncharacterized protein n=1 Tax=Portunus trituberculatus TaxID=210409 RepID=A0A5B7CX20_PORTR|nr:hypothetical protein [Portunus trituberculatus]
MLVHNNKEVDRGKEGGKEGGERLGEQGISSCCHSVTYPVKENTLALIAQHHSMGVLMNTAVWEGRLGRMATSTSEGAATPQEGKYNKSSSQG